MILDTPEKIAGYRMLTLRKGLQVEAETGMQLTRGRSCYAMIKEEFGLRGNKANVLRQFEELLRNHGILES